MQVTMMAGPFDFLNKASGGGGGGGGAGGDYYTVSVLEFTSSEEWEYPVVFYNYASLKSILYCVKHLQR